MIFLVILIYLIIIMAPRKKTETKMKKGRLEPDTDSEMLAEVVILDMPDPTAILTRSMPPTPKGKGKSATPRKKARQETEQSGQAPITHEMDDDLADWFEAHPIFFDQSVTDLKKWAKHDKLLAEKADELGVTRSTFWTWFTNMRTMFGRLKKKSGRVTKHRQPGSSTSFTGLYSCKHTCKFALQLLSLA